MNTYSDLFLQQLKNRLNNPLPGSTSHQRMLPPGRTLQHPSEQGHYHESAVLILLFPSKDQLYICLIRRPTTMKNHAGQIAFPGGRKEKEDKDLIFTALREAEEEIGLGRESAEILGLLSPVYVHVSNFLITCKQKLQMHRKWKIRVHRKWKQQCTTFVFSNVA